tara:strand:+ start:195 stop:674 length:480 start_codon:yes stop_codon:yes gene_type:complete
MKKNKIKPYILLLFCALIACVILDVVRDFYQDLSFSEIFYRNPFEACRVLTGHYYQDIYYGGLTNFLAMMAMYFFYGLFVGGIGGTGIYALSNKYLFRINNEPNIWNEVAERPKIIFFVFLLFIGPIYDFLIYSYYSLLNENYNCEFLIKTIENSWYFE